jgi:hypothetical protein
MKWLIGACGLGAVARNVFVVEEFPYHSRSYRAGWAVPSRAYSLELIRRAVQRTAILILLRSGGILKQAVPEVHHPTFCWKPSISNLHATC